MPNITRRRTGELLQALFRILDDEPEGLRARDALAALRQKRPPTQYELGTFPSGGVRYDKIVRFATVDCVKAMWMYKQDGRWFVNDAGMKAVEAIPDPEAFYRRASQLYRRWKKAQDDESDEQDLEQELSGEEPSDQEAIITLEMAQDQARDQIEAHLQTTDPIELQHLFASLLTAMGHYVAWVSPPGPDDGIDVLAYLDPLGITMPRMKVQVKRKTDPVPVDDIRSFMSSIGKDEVGIFVSTGGFTKGAEQCARNERERRITLINLDGLLRLWIEHYPKLDEAAKRRLPLQPIYFLAPEG